MKKSNSNRSMRNYLDWNLCDRALAEAQIDIQESKGERPRLLKQLAESHCRQLPIVNQDDIDKLQVLHQDYPNMSSVIDEIEGQMHLQSMMGAPLKIPPLLLLGPAGVGKTAFGYALAAELDMSFEYRSFADVTASFVLTGTSTVWSSGRPGIVADLCLNAKSQTAPLIFIDEIDKAGMHAHRPDNALLSLLEPRSSRAFIDEYLGIPLDVSPVSWVLAANNLAQVRPEIISRMRVIHVSCPTQTQMPKIVSSVDRQLRQQYPGFDNYIAPLCSASVARLTSQPVREIKKLLEGLYVEIARQRFSGIRQITPELVDRVIERSRPRRSAGISEHPPFTLSPPPSIQ